MPTVEEYTDPFVDTFTPPPAARTGVCEICHSWTSAFGVGGRYRLCSGCERTTRAVERPVGLIVPVSLVKGGSQLYSVLWGYKNSRDAAARDRMRLQIGAMLARFLRDHGGCVQRAAGSEWDVMTIVPSSSGRTGIHPLELAVKMAQAHRPLYRRLLERTDVHVDHRVADDRAYRATEEVESTRVLLIDDTFTSGARIQSAASCLARAGADVVAAVILGRMIHPEFGPEAAALWEEQTAIPFAFDVCCLGYDQ